MRPSLMPREVTNQLVIHELSPIYTRLQNQTVVVGKYFGGSIKGGRTVTRGHRRENILGKH